MLTFIDANCRVGPWMGMDGGLPYDAHSLEWQLGHYGIAWALCTHRWSEEYDALEGNLRMGEIATAHPTLRVCASVLPPACDHYPGPSQLPEHLDSVQALAARLSPRLHGYEPIQTVIGDALDVLAERGIPVVIAAAEIEWRELDALLTAHPRLMVVLEGLGYQEDRTLFPMMARHAELRLETSRYVGHGAIEAVVTHFGVHRVLFGSGLPALCPGAAIARVLFARLSDEDKQAIAGGNLCQLTRDRMVAW